MKFDSKSFAAKLWLYFTLFAAVILIMLWLLQTVFLQSFYEHMKVSSIEAAAKEISQAYGSPEFADVLDDATFQNSILAIVTDVNGNVLYTADEHTRAGGKPDAKVIISSDDSGAFKVKGNIRQPLENGENTDAERFDSAARPPVAQAQFFKSQRMSHKEFVSELLSNSGTSKLIKYSDDGRGRFLIFGQIIGDADEVLYITTPLDAINATTSILRTQLIYVTVIALLLSFFIAFLISRKFSKPIKSITIKAEELAHANYDITFESGFCSELDELAAALNIATAELSKVEKLRRELIANVSHDLRTPLTMIKAYAEMIIDISGDNKEKREEHLKVITNETNRLTTLVNDILDVSAYQSDGQQSLQLTSVNLSDTVKRVVSRFDTIARHEGYEIKTDIAKDQYVSIDEKKMEQVLYNLISNAINYIGDDKVVEVKLIDDGDAARLEVIDNGEGIADDALPYIWDRYYKAATHKRAVIGTGLGLSIVKGILEAHGAKFGVDSEVGNGSKFWFSITK